MLGALLQLCIRKAVILILLLFVALILRTQMHTETESGGPLANLRLVSFAELDL